MHKQRGCGRRRGGYHRGWEWGERWEGARRLGMRTRLSMMSGGEATSSPPLHPTPIPPHVCRPPSSPPLPGGETPRHPRSMAPDPHSASRQRGFETADVIGTSPGSGTPPPPRHTGTTHSQFPVAEGFDFYFSLLIRCSASASSRVPKRPHSTPRERQNSKTSNPQHSWSPRFTSVGVPCGPWVPVRPALVVFMCCRNTSSRRLILNAAYRNCSGTRATPW